MLKAEENKALTEVGKGKPMGEFMRRYWIPAAKSEQVPKPGPGRLRASGCSARIWWYFARRRASSA